MRISDWSSDVCSSDLSGDGVVGLTDLLRSYLAAFGARFRDAVAQVVAQQGQRHCFQGLSRGRNMSEDVDAVFVFVDHSGDAAHLTLDPTQSLLQVVFVRSEEHTSELQLLMSI